MEGAASTYIHCIDTAVARSLSVCSLSLLRCSTILSHSFFALPLVLSLPYLLAPVSLFIIDAFLSAALSQKPKESDIGWI